MRSFRLLCLLLLFLCVVHANISYPWFKQYDDQWKTVTLGASGKPLSRIGCAVTSIAMGLAGHGVSICERSDPCENCVAMNPGSLAKLLNANGGFTGGGGIYWGKVESLSNQRVRNVCLKEKSNRAKVAEFLKNGDIVVGKVTTRLSGDTWVSTSSHYILLTGMHGDKYITNDPGTRTGDGCEYPPSNVVEIIAWSLNGPGICLCGGKNWESIASSASTVANGGSTGQAPTATLNTDTMPTGVVDESATIPTSQGGTWNMNQGSSYPTGQSWTASVSAPRGDERPTSAEYYDPHLLSGFTNMASDVFDKLYSPLSCVHAPASSTDAYVNPYAPSATGHMAPSDLQTLRTSKSYWGGADQPGTLSGPPLVPVRSVDQETPGSLVYRPMTHNPMSAVDLSAWSGGRSRTPEGFLPYARLPGSVESITDPALAVQAQRFNPDPQQSSSVVSTTVLQPEGQPAVSAGEPPASLNES